MRATSRTRVTFHGSWGAFSHCVMLSGTTAWRMVYIFLIGSRGKPFGLSSKSLFGAVDAGRIFETPTVNSPSSEVTNGTSDELQGEHSGMSTSLTTSSFDAILARCPTCLTRDALQILSSRLPRAPLSSRSHKHQFLYLKAHLRVLAHQ